MTDQNQSDAAGNFLAHLIELRNRIMRAVVAVLAVFICIAPFSATIFNAIATPMMKALPKGAGMIATGVTTPFLIPVKISLLMAFLISLPYVLHQIWSFIVPGLYAHERRLIAPLIVSSYALFLIGIGFCYFFVFSIVFNAIYQFAPSSIAVAPDIESYFNFVISMFIAFGLTFEVPVVVLMLVCMKIISLQRLKEIRCYVIVGAFIVSAIVTPPDVASQLLLAIPLCLLYEVGLLAASFFAKPLTARQSP